MWFLSCYLKEYGNMFGFLAIYLRTYKVIVISVVKFFVACLGACVFQLA